MGSLRRRGEIWWIRYYRNGRRFEESSGSNLKSVAKALLTDREHKVQHGPDRGAEFAAAHLREAAADLEAEYEANGRRSLDSIKRYLALHLTPYFGGARMMDITTAQRHGLCGASAEGKCEGRHNKPRVGDPEKNFPAGNPW